MVDNVEVDFPFLDLEAGGCIVLGRKRIQFQSSSFPPHSILCILYALFLSFFCTKAHLRAVVLPAAFFFRFYLSCPLVVLLRRCSSEERGIRCMACQMHRVVPATPHPSVKFAYFFLPFFLLFSFHSSSSIQSDVGLYRSLLL